MPHYSRLLCVQPASRSLHLGSLLPQQQLFRAPNSLCPGCGGTLVYGGAAANCFSSHAIVAAPSRQGKSCQPSFYLVPRVCALKEARSAPGGRRTKPQPPPPLPQSAISLEGLKPGREGRAVRGQNRSWEGIWRKEQELGTNGGGCVCPGTLSEPLALPAPAGPDKSRPYLLPKGHSLKGKLGLFTARLVPCRNETPLASAVPLALMKEALSYLPYIWALNASGKILGLECLTERLSQNLHIALNGFSQSSRSLPSLVPLLPAPQVSSSACARAGGSAQLFAYFVAKIYSSGRNS